MEEFDILIAKVPFENSEDYKWRPVFILSVNGKTIKFLRITTKYDTKSDGKLQVQVSHPGKPVSACCN